MEKPELILPASSKEKMDFAFMYGADIVYLGLTGFSMRSRVNGFSPEMLEKAIGEAHDLGKKVFVTTNIFPHNSKIDVFIKHIKFLATVKPDALIVANPGVFSIIKEYYPDAKIHISVQANSVNYRDVMFWQQQGAKRVVLPRELSLNEIKEIHEKVPDMELETFVHGAICMAYSGRCLMSQYLTNRDANQGICAQSCRWKYKTYIEEEMRPGEFMEVQEDEHGSYILNARDLCAIEYLKDLVDAGVTGFKVEGRSKTIYYLSTVAKTYRRAIDDMMAGKEYDPLLLTELKKTANRGYSPGFLKGIYDDKDIHYEKNRPIQTHKFIGVVRDHKSLDGKNLCEIEVRNKIEKGGDVEILTPNDFKETQIKNMFDLEGNPINEAHGGASNKLMEIGDDVPVGSFLRQEVA